MANKKISELNALDALDVQTDDLMLIVDRSSLLTPSGENKSITVGELLSFTQNIPFNLQNGLTITGSLTVSGSIITFQQTSSTVGGGVAGYLNIQINGTNYKMPFYPV